MCKCKKTNCNGGCGANSSNSAEQIANQVAELTEQVATLTENAKFLICAHPILLIEHADDIAQFDLDSGKGIDCWDGWAICNGGTHFSKNAKKNITTPNFTDRFIVQAGGNYAVDDTGGADDVTLDITQIPSHDHPVTDPGHTHDITDPGHTHATSDPGHTHGGTGGSHTHTFETSVIGGHEHSTGVIGITDGGGGTGANVRTSSADIGNSTSTNGEHSHSGTTDATAAGVTISESFTGVSNQNAFIGITETESHVTDITVGNRGGGLAHENRPPYYAALYVMKL